MFRLHSGFNVSPIRRNLMHILVLNGSPRRKGTVARLMAEVVNQTPENPSTGSGAALKVTWIDAYNLKIQPCVGCMKCRPDGACVMREDDGHRVASLLAEADALVVGTPTYWGNMSGPLKVLFDRMVPALMGETDRGLPRPLHKGKPAVIVTACTTPWPFNFIAAESRGALRAVGEVLHYAGFKTVGKVVKPGSKSKPQPDERLFVKARRLGNKMRRSAAKR